MQKRGGGLFKKGVLRKGDLQERETFFLFFFREGNISEREGTCQRGKITREGD